MHIPEWLRQGIQNKYVAATLLALFWTTFIHDLGLPFTIRESRALAKAKQELADLEHRNELLRQTQATLLNDAQALECFARERYFMRRPDEEVYRIVE